MKRIFAICGATGPVGRVLVPALVERGIEPLIVGRDPEKARRLYPNHACITYDELSGVAGSLDLVVNLAAINNDAEGNEAQFERVNVDLAVEIAEAAQPARVVYVSSFHTFEEHPTSPYARSKARGEQALGARPDLDTLALRLPAVTGIENRGQLAKIDSLPGPVRGLALSLAKALRPTVSVDELARFLCEEAKSWPDESTELSTAQRGNAVYAIGSRMIDVGFALAILLIFGWLLAVLWLLIRVDSAGPGLFCQRRVGREGREFTLYKFRTMRNGTAQAGTHEIGATSITRVGGWLRRTKIDELPQVLNILRGQLSLVGPRPCLPVQIELIRERERRGVFAARPGITGLAQIEDIDMSDPERLARRDRQYLMRRSLLFDLKIIIATFLGRGKGDRTAP